MPHRQTVAEVDLVHDAHVLLVVGVELLGRDPLVAGKVAAWLQHTVDLAIHLLQLQRQNADNEDARGRHRSCQTMRQINLQRRVLVGRLECITAVA